MLENLTKGEYAPMRIALCRTKAAYFHRSSTIPWLVAGSSANDMQHRVPFAIPIPRCGTGDQNKAIDLVRPVRLFFIRTSSMGTVMPISHWQVTRLTSQGRGSIAIAPS
jgi:hypothetical protein